MESRLILPTQLDFVPVAQAFVRSVALRWSLTEKQADQLAEAGAEAVRMILRLAFAGDETGTVELCARPVAGGLKVVLCDKGTPVYAADLENAESMARIRARVDEVELQNRGLDGLETHLVKYQEKTPFGATVKMVQPRSSETPSGLKAEEFLIRPMREQDAPEVSRCVYSCYGYSYGALEAAYYPERLAELNRVGQIMSLVAIAPDGDLAGHIALEREGPEATLAVAGVAAVKPRYRSCGLGSRLGTALYEATLDTPVRALTAYAVTSHLYSQKLLGHFGFQPSCLILGTASFWFRDIREEAAPRESLLGAYRNLGDPVRYKLYPPVRHRAMVETICRGLGWDCTFVDPDQPQCQPGATRLLLREYPVRALAKLNVDYFGSQVVERVRNHLRYLRLHEYKQFTLTLPLTDPHTYFMTAAFEKMGFFFAGVVPSEPGPLLMLQYLHGVAIDYQQIHLDSEMSREILAYIQYLDPEAF